MTDAEFLTAANLVANKYKMTLDIDFRNRVINFIGEYDQETGLQCAIELDDVLGNQISGQGLTFGDLFETLPNLEIR